MSITEMQRAAVDDPSQRGQGRPAEAGVGRDERAPHQLQRVKGQEQYVDRCAQYIDLRSLGASIPADTRLEQQSSAGQTVPPAWWQRAR